MAVDQSDVTIIIPAYNERDAIGAVVQDLKAALPGAEIIVVNDGSTDETEERARIAGAHIIRHDSRLGYGAALKSGIAHSSRAYVLFCDGDGQHSIDDVRRLIEACDGYDMVVGARTAESHTPFLRKPGKLILKWFANFIAGVNIPDLNSGLRILKRDVLVRYLHLMPLGFSFSTTSTFAMLKANRRFKFIPITTGKRVGSSTVRQFSSRSRSVCSSPRSSVSPSTCTIEADSRIRLFFSRYRASSFSCSGFSAIRFPP
jgi:prepilin-type processing-associated H-X9-DG protein